MHATIYSRINMLFALIVLVMLFVSENVEAKRWVTFSKLAQKQSADADNLYEKPKMDFTDEGINGTVIDYKFSGAVVVDVEENGVQYQHISIDQFGKLGDVGKPQLPQRVYSFAVPFGAKPKIQIIDTQIDTLEGFRIYPALPPASDLVGAPEPKFTIDDEFYSKDTLYPSSPVSLYDIRELRGTSIAMVRLCPVQYNPQTGKLVVYSKLKFKVSFESSRGPASVKSPAFRSGISNVVVNKSVVTQAETDAEYTSTFLIVTTNEYKNAADTLALWKRQMGYDVIIESKEAWSGGSEVKTVIHNRYNINSIEFFVIIGDHEDVPAQYADFGSDHHVTDLYYACVGGTGDFLPDMGYGRISVSNANEALNVVRKIINYERNPPLDSSFYNTGLTAAYFQQDTSRPGYAQRRFAQTSWEIRKYLIEQGYSIDRVFYTESTVSPTNWNSGSYSWGEEIPDSLQKPHFDWGGDRTDISNGINIGRFLVVHRDHGAVWGWGDPQFTWNDLNSLDNKDLLPVVLSMNCNTGLFNDTTCFSEYFLRNNNGGAVGVVAASTESYSGQNDALTLGIIDAIWPDPGIVPKFPHNSNPSVSPHDTILQIGLTLNQGKMRMTETWNRDGRYSRDYEKLTYELFNYFGDPTMRIWTTVPKTITAMIPDAVVVGQNLLTISGISCVRGMATLFYDGEIVASEKIVNGVVDLHINPVLSDAGTVTLTITSPNCRPLILNIPVENKVAGIQALQPVQTDSFAVGDTIKIKWSNNGAMPAFVKLQFSFDGGNTFTDIERSISNTGEYDWIAADVNSDDCKIRISDATEDSLADTTESFTIYRLSIVSGTVTPAGEVEVYYFDGPLSGSVTTDSMGAYSFPPLPPGTYKIYAKRGMLISDTMTFTVPPDKVINVSFNCPLISVTPEKIKQSLVQGDSVELSMTIANTGNSDLSFNIDVDDSSALTSDYKYAWTDSDQSYGPVYKWDDLSDNVAGSPMPYNGYYLFSLPFSFSFYGNEYDDFYLNSNGTISFGGHVEDTVNRRIPVFDSSNNLIAPFWDNLDSGGVIYVAGNENRIVIQFQDIKINGHPLDSITFQVVIQKNGDIIFYYKNGFNSALDHATVGIENESGTDGLEIAFDTSYLHDSMAVRISTQPKWLSISPVDGIVPPGDTEIINVRLKSSDLAVQNCIAILSVNHNDPGVANPFVIPCTLIVVDSILPTVYFEDSLQTVYENVGSVTVEVSVSSKSANDITIPYSVSGTADTTDYTLENGIITIPADSLKGSITFEIIDDDIFELNETVVITLGFPDHARPGARIQHTVIIQDNDVPPEVTFDVDSQSINEDADSIELIVNLSKTCEADVTVPFTVNSTADSGTDYSIPASPIVIAAGEISGIIKITVLDDEIYGSDETVVITMGTPLNGIKGTITESVLTIKDNDPAPEVQFTKENTVISENEGTINIQIALSQKSGIDLSVPFSVTGTAVEGTDYTITSSPIEIKAGDTTAEISLTVIDNESDDGDKTAVVTLDNPPVAQLGILTRHTITVTDNDFRLIVQTDSSGSVKPDRDSVFQKGDTVKISATPVENYFFESWEIGSGDVLIAECFAESTYIVGFEGPVTIKANFIKGGFVNVSGIQSNTDVFMYGTAGWNGLHVSTGESLISGLRPQKTVMVLKQNNKRTEYIPLTIESGDTLEISTDLRDAVTMFFDKRSPLKVGEQSIVTGIKSSSVFEDIDGDGDQDLIILTSDGKISIYENVNGDLSLPVDLSTGISNTTCLRVVDWGSDGKVDLVVSSFNGEIYLLEGNTTKFSFSDPDLLYDTRGSCSGFEIFDVNGDYKPDFVVGRSDGTIIFALSQTDGWENAEVVSGNGNALCAGENVSPMCVDISGDGIFDLVAGTGSGDVKWYRNNGDNSFAEMGSVSEKGSKLTSSGTARISKKYNSTGDLPIMILSDGAGNVWSLEGLLTGDFDNNGKVDFNDYMIFVNAWNTSQENENWNPLTNIGLSEGVQKIDFIDFMQFVNCWGNEK